FHFGRSVRHLPPDDRPSSELVGKWTSGPDGCRGFARFRTSTAAVLLLSRATFSESRRGGSSRNPESVQGSPCTRRDSRCDLASTSSSCATSNDSSVTRFHLA